ELRGVDKLLGGIHAAKGPATVSGQGPVEMVGLQVCNQGTTGIVGMAAWRIGFPIRASPGRAFWKATD
ncbi:hypothetical protein J7432_20250, partial [Xanthomonas axonopodis pv. begoniae]|nr:hypothetical protein [Xanthomonas axonopodis pv. begoniae]MBO9773355.1 hypothetical protein [Xanthomonas axonopodis pv. begoniae]